MRRALPLVGLILVYAKIVVTEAHLAPLDSDEGMYSGAAWCVASGRTLYRDVVFTQTPGAALLYGGLIQTIGYSLAGMRLLNGLFVVAVAALAAGLVQRHAGGNAELRRRAGLVAFVALAFSDFFLTYNIIARNYAPALALALAAMLLAMEAADARQPARSKWMALAAGLCLGLAVTFKHSMVVLAPIIAWIAARPVLSVTWRDRMTCWVCHLAGLALGLAPTAWYALRAPDAFLFGTFKIHQLIAAWRVESHHPGTGLGNKWWIWVGSLVRYGWVITAPALVSLFALVGLRWTGRRSTRFPPQHASIATGPPGRMKPSSQLLESSGTQVLDDQSSTLAGIAGVAAIALAALYFWLTPTWPDYATQVLPFLAAVAAGGVIRVLSRRPATIALAAMAILAMATNPKSLDRLLTRRLDHPSQLARLEACGQWLRDHVRSGEPVLCVFPPYLLAAGRDPTFELAGGITAMNVADRMSAPRRREWRVMSAQEMLERAANGEYAWVVTGTTSPPGLVQWLSDAPDWRLAAYWSGGLAVYESLARGGV